MPDSCQVSSTERQGLSRFFKKTIKNQQLYQSVIQWQTQQQACWTGAGSQRAQTQFGNIACISFDRIINNTHADPRVANKSRDVPSASKNACLSYPSFLVLLMPYHRLIQIGPAHRCSPRTLIELYLTIVWKSKVIWMCLFQTLDKMTFPRMLCRVCCKNIRRFHYYVRCDICNSHYHIQCISFFQGG